MKSVIAFLIVLALTSLAFSAEYVGSGTCKACHSDKFESWSQTLHSKMLQVPSQETVIGDFTGTITLSEPSHNIPPVNIELSGEGGVYTVKIGDTVYTVEYTLGSKWKQRYLTRVGNSIYILPIQWNTDQGKWVAYHLRDWFDETGTPKELSKTAAWDRRCAGCHSTGTSPSVSDGEFIAKFSEINIGCEACHGPGSEHAATADKTKIVNPEDIEDFLTKNQVCGRCHVRGKSTGGTYGYPYDEVSNVGFQPGDKLEDFFIEGGGYWGDGTSKKHHQQFEDWLKSEHADNPYHKVGCSDCHDPHGSNLEADLVADADNNELCLSCHGPHGFENTEAITKHTQHEYEPEKGESRCIECHMPKVAKSAVPYDIRSHTFEFISPAKGIEYNMPDSCTSCHDGVKAVAMTKEEALGNYKALLVKAGCGTCHEEDVEYKEWATSGHAESLEGLKSSSHAKDFCLKCHSADYITAPEDEKPTLETAVNSITCAACHIHDSGLEHNLLTSVEETCVQCHTMGEAKPGKAVHHPQKEMFAGVGGAGVPDMPSGHTKNLKEKCVECHMYKEEENVVAEEGGHTFEPNIAACTRCHADAESKEALVQAEISTLLDGLQAELDKFADKESDVYKEAKFNYEMVKADGSLGVHNYPYARALLNKSYSLLGASLPAVEAKFTMDLVKGLNMISLPVKPLVPYTARSLAEELNATVVIALDERRQRFVGFTPQMPGNGFSIEGGKGYIVNLKEATKVTFTGTAWTNEPVAGAAPSITDSAWAFLVTGYIYDEHEEKVIDGSYRVVVRNLDSGLEASDTLGSAGEGWFSIAWANLSRQDVVKVGDRVELEIRDAIGNVLNSLIYTIKPEDIRNASITLKLRFKDVIPKVSWLGQSFPNPSNPEAWIPFQLSEGSYVTIRIFDLNGKLVRTLNLGYRDAGIYVTRSKAAYWDGRNRRGEKVSSGIYFYQMEAGSFKAVGRMVVAR